MEWMLSGKFGKVYIFWNGKIKTEHLIDLEVG